MTDNSGGLTCVLGCWLIAALGGALAFGLLMILGGWMFMQAAFVAAFVLVLAGGLLTWLMCRPLPVAGEMPVAKPAPMPPAAEETTPGTPDDGSNADAVDTAPAASAAPKVKPTKELPGEAELAAKKGEWKYEGDGESEASPAAADDSPGTKPTTLSAARDGKADDLKQIKGVGPKLEKVCNSLGFYHFDQIAAWTADEVAWVDANLEGFKGRVTRDDWVAQAKVLAEGGSTEFSKKVKKGDVY